MNPYELYPKIRKEKRIIAEALKGKKFDSVLELGCQWGENLVAIRDSFPNKLLVGIDINEEVIKEARKYIYDISLDVGNAKDTNFESKSFDIVFANALLCMVSPLEVDQIVQEMIRLARKYIFLVELDTQNRIDFVSGGRIGANWENIFSGYHLECIKEKIPFKMWSAQPWATYGYLIQVKI